MSNTQKQALNHLLKDKPLALDHLCSLYSWFSSECLEITTEEHPKSDSLLSQEVLVSSALKLSRSLQKCVSPTWPVFLETQLRTLVAAFALLHLKEGKAISWDAHQTIQIKGIDRLYSEITAYNHDKTSAVRKIKSRAPQYRDGDPQTATNVYLVQLAMQYFSLFGCFTDRKYETTSHALDVVFASLSLYSGQYGHIRQIIEGISGIADVWITKKPELHPICLLQEHVRRATSLLSARPQDHRIDDGDIEKMLANVLGQIEVIFDDFKDHSKGSKAWHSGRTMFRLKPPKIDSTYYFYGLLDCMAQLCAFIDLKMARPSLYRKLKNVALKATVIEFRWKAIECLLSYSTTRDEVCQSLLSSVPSSRNLQQQKEAMERDLDYTCSLLEVCERDGAKNIPGSSLSCCLSSTIGNDSGLTSPQSSRTNSYAPWPEQHDVMRRDRGSQKSRDFTKYVAKIDTNVERFPKCNVALASDCQHVCFYTAKDLMVFDVKRPNSSPLRVDVGAFLRSDTGKTQDILFVAITQRHLILITKHESGHFVHIRSLDNRASLSRSTWQEGTPKALQVHETATALNLFVSVSVASRGRVHFYDLSRCDSQRGSLGTPDDVLKWPDKRLLKHLHLHSRSGTLAAVTHDNTIYLWRNLLDQISESREELYKFQDREPDWSYKPQVTQPDWGDHVRKDRGITSISLFQPSSTVSPSSPSSSTSEASELDVPLYLFFTYYPPRGGRTLNSIVLVVDDAPETHHINALPSLPRTLTSSCVSEVGNLLAVLHHPNTDFPTLGEYEDSTTSKMRFWSRSQEKTMGKEVRQVGVWGIDKPSSNDPNATTSISPVLEASRAAAAVVAGPSPIDYDDDYNNDDKGPCPNSKTLRGADRAHPAQPAAIRFENEYQTTSSGERVLSRLWLWAADATGKVFAQAYVPP